MINIANGHDLVFAQSVADDYAALAVLRPLARAACRQARSLKSAAGRQRADAAHGAICRAEVSLEVVVNESVRLAFKYGQGLFCRPGAAA